jgi:hypothetical protein
MTTATIICKMLWPKITFCTDYVSCLWKGGGRIPALNQYISYITVSISLTWNVQLCNEMWDKETGRPSSKDYEGVVPCRGMQRGEYSAVPNITVFNSLYLDCILASCYIRLILNIRSFVHQCNTFTSYFLLIIDMFRPHTAIFKCYTILSWSWCSVMPIFAYVMLPAMCQPCASPDVVLIVSVRKDNTIILTNGHWQ